MTTSTRRVLLHDFGGYAFVAQLARELARRGHQVRHLHWASLRNGKGELALEADDPDTLTFAAIELDRDFDRYAAVERWRLERRYASALAAAATAWQPDVVVSANTPLLVLWWLRPALARAGIPLVNWLQDLHSVALGQAVAEKSALVARAANPVLEQIESRLLRACAHVVAISPDFLPVLQRWSVPADRVTVVTNWAELQPRPQRHNPFSAAHRLDDRIVLLYAGTLGFKHEPAKLVALVEAFRDRPEVTVMVVSEGPGRRWLEQQRRTRELSQLILLDFQPHGQVMDVLGSADVLLSMLRANAGQFSVPSKILDYLVAGRAQLAALPADNLAARVLAQSGGGVVVDPDADEDWTGAARRLIDDGPTREQLGAQGRAYAEARFDVGAAATAFEVCLAQTARSEATSL